MLSASMGEIGKQRQLNQMEQYGVRTWFLQDEMDFEILIEAGRFHGISCIKHYQTLLK